MFFFSVVVFSQNETPWNHLCAFFSIDMKCFASLASGSSVCKKNTDRGAFVSLGQTDALSVSLPVCVCIPGSCQKAWVA